MAAPRPAGAPRRFPGAPPGPRVPDAPGAPALDPFAPPVQPPAPLAQPVPAPEPTLVGQPPSTIAPRARLRYTVRNAATSSTARHIQALHPEVEFEWTGGPNHPHLILATDRAVTERKIYGELQPYQGLQHDRLVVEIGGAVHRTQALYAPIHYCNPIITAADILRYARDAHLTPFLCQCRAEQCYHAPAPMTYVGVHVVYYLTPPDLLLLVHRARGPGLYPPAPAAVMYFHLFSTPSGEMALGEARWRPTAAGLAMDVSGNPTPYTHTYCQWLRDGYYERDGLAMAWDLQRSGLGFVAKFWPAPIGLRPNQHSTMLDPWRWLHDQSHYGEPFNMHLGPAAKHAPASAPCTLTSFGPTVYAEWRGDQLELPKLVICEALPKFVGLRRDANTYNAAVGHVKRLLEQAIVRPDQRAAAVSLVTAIAFTMNLRQETLDLEFVSDFIAEPVGLLPRMFAGWTTRATGAYESWFSSETRAQRHQRYLALNPEQPQPPAPTALQLALGAAGLVTIVALRRQYTSAMQANIFSVVPAALTLFALAVAIVRALWPRRPAPPSPPAAEPPAAEVIPRDLSAAAIETVVAHYRATHESTALPPGIYCAPAPLAFPGYQSPTPLLDLAPGVRVQVPAEQRPHDPDAIALTLHGLGVPSCIPLVASTTTENELRALVNRQLCTTAAAEAGGAPDPDFWDAFVAWHDDPQVSTWLYPRMPDVVEDPDWQAYLTTRIQFTEEHKTMLTDHRDRVHQFGFHARDFAISAFNKKEKVLKSASWHKEDFDPRNISARQPALNAILAPWMLAYGKHLGRSWSLSHIVTYASSHTAEEIGLWYGGFFHAPLALPEPAAPVLMDHDQHNAWPHAPGFDDVPTDPEHADPVPGNAPRLVCGCPTDGIVLAGRYRIDAAEWTRMEQDCSRFDLNFGKHIIDHQHTQFLKRSPPRLVREAMERAHFTKGRTSTGIRFSRTHDDPGDNRHSGDCDTSIGNSQFNGALTVFAAHRYACTCWQVEQLSRTGLAILHDLSGAFRVIVHGDDNVSIARRDFFTGHIGYNTPPRHQVNGAPTNMNLAEYVALAFEAVGHKPKWHARADATEFCSSLFVPAIVQYRDRWYASYKLTSKPGRLYARLGYSLTPQGESASYMRAIAASISVDCHHCRPAAALVRTTYRLTRGAKAALSRYEKIRLARREQFNFRGLGVAHADDETTGYLNARYELSTQHWDTIDAVLRAVPSFPAFVSHPLVDALVAVDAPLSGFVVAIALRRVRAALGRLVSIVNALPLPPAVRAIPLVLLHILRTLETMATLLIIGLVRRYVPPAPPNPAAGHLLPALLTWAQNTNAGALWARRARRTQAFCTFLVMMPLYTALGAAVEEYVRRLPYVGRPFHHFLTWAEPLVYIACFRLGYYGEVYARLPLTTSLTVRAPAMIMHAALGYTAYWPAVLIHTAFNIAAFAVMTAVPGGFDGL
jgi:hypothetical protein